MTTIVQTFLRLCLKSHERNSSLSSQIDSHFENDRAKSINSLKAKYFDSSGNILIASDFVTKEIWNKALRQLQRHDQSNANSKKKKKDKIHHRFLSEKNNFVPEKINLTNFKVEKCQNADVSLQFPENSLKSDKENFSQLPEPIFDLFVFLAKEGVRINGLFRRPGNISDMKNILINLSNDVPVEWRRYNIYTVANVAKRFLICLPHGIFGVHGEKLLLRTARMRCSSIYENGQILNSVIINDGSMSPEDRMRLEVFANVVNKLPQATRELVILTFGIFHNMVENGNATDASNATLLDIEESSKENSSLGIYISPEKIIIAEGIAKSVAGSIFHSSAHAVSEIDSATIIIKSLLLNFQHLPKELTKIYKDALSGHLRPLPSTVVQQDKIDSTLTTNEQADNYATSIKGNLKLYAVRFFCFSHSSHEDVRGKGSIKMGHLKKSIRDDFGPKTSVSSYIDSDFNLSSGVRRSSVSVTLNKESEKILIEKIEKATQTSILKQHSKTDSETSATTSTYHQKPIHISSVNWHESVDEAESSTIIISSTVHLKSRPSLSRRHSRYKSIQRRQMATLALKSAWFLTEQPIPVICLPHDLISDQDCCDNDQQQQQRISTLSLIDMNNEWNTDLDCPIHLTASATDIMLGNNAMRNDIIDETNRHQTFLHPCSTSLLSLQSAPDKLDNSPDLIFNVVGFNFIRPYTWPSTHPDKDLHQVADLRNLLKH